MNAKSTSARKFSPHSTVENKDDDTLRIIFAQMYFCVLFNHTFPAIIKSHVVDVLFSNVRQNKSKK